MKDGSIGLLQLANAPFTAPGFVSAPETWGRPLIARQVPGAYVDRVARGDRELEGRYVDTAIELEAQGACALLSNCGLTVRYQAALQATVSIPVITSSLLGLAALQAILPKAKSVGVLTYDRHACEIDLFPLLGVEETRVSIGALNGTEAFDMLAGPAPDCDMRLLESDLMHVVDDLVAQAGDGLGALLVECTTFCPLVPRIRAEKDIAVVDYVCYAGLLLQLLCRQSGEDSGRTSPRVWRQKGERKRHV